MDLDDITTTKINNHFGNVFPHVMYCGCPSTGFVRFSLRRSKLGEGLDVVLKDRNDIIQVVDINLLKAVYE